MADQGSAEQLLELLVQLKRTTPKAARDILNSQPAIAYALISLMVSMGAINVEVFQKILAQYHESNTRGQATQSIPAIPPAATPAPSTPALPLHLQAQYRTATPPMNAITQPTATYGYPSQPAYPPSQTYPPSLAGSSAVGYAAYGGQPQPQPAGYPPYPQPGYAAPPPAVPTAARPQSTPTIKPEVLAAFPEEQKALIMHVVSMTQEQLNKLPPEQRNTYVQIRTTLGIS